VSQYPNKESAQKDIDEHFSLLQPENVYEAVKIEDCQSKVKIDN
jgi:hypothetical protein